LSGSDAPERKTIKEVNAMELNRRAFLKTSGAALMATALPMSLVKVAFGSQAPGQDFTFGYISDAHIQPSRGTSSCATGTWA
jgi:secreted PhoX family phosphatase